MKRLWLVLLLAIPLGCRTSETDSTGDTNSTAAAVVPSADESAPDHQSTMLVFSVDGMQCPTGCPPVVKSALESVEGVEEVQVDYAAKQARIKVDAECFDQTAAVEALDFAGFQARLN